MHDYDGLWQAMGNAAGFIRFLILCWLALVAGIGIGMLGFLMYHWLGG